MIKLIIAGGRDFNDYPLLETEAKKMLYDCWVNDYYHWETCNKLSDFRNHVIIVSGKAPGADSLGEQFAKKYNFLIEPFPADWNNIKGVSPVFIKYNKFGKPYNSRAGHDRNEEMAKFGTHLLLFWDGQSKGSKNMLENAQKYNLTYKIIKYE